MYDDEKINESPVATTKVLTYIRHKASINTTHKRRSRNNAILIIEKGNDGEARFVTTQCTT